MTVMHHSPLKPRSTPANQQFTLAAVAKPPAWTAEAPCASTDPDLYHPERGRKGYSTKAAKQLCWEKCPVRQECLDWALSFEAGVDDNRSTQTYGIYGGLSANQRRRLLTERKQQKETT